MGYQRAFVQSLHPQLLVGGIMAYTVLENHKIKIFAIEPEEEKIA